MFTLKIMMRLCLLLLTLQSSILLASEQTLNSQLKNKLAEGYLAARLHEGQIVEGELFKISHVKWGEVQALKDLSFLHFHGKPASASVTSQIVEELREHLLGSGFIFASIEFDIEEGSAPHTVNLLLKIETGSRFKLGPLIFTGTKTRAEILNRMSLLKLGETYDYRRVERAIFKLSRTGYFSSVYQNALTRDSTKNLVYPVIQLSDYKANHIAGVLGYNNEDNLEGNELNGFVDIELLNLVGTARDLEFHFAAQNREKQIQFAYKEPWIGSLPFGASFDLNLLIEDSAYHETNIGMAVFQDINFNSRYNLSFTRQFNETFFLKDSFDGFRDTLIFTSFKSQALISGIEVIQDWRDKVPSTLKGGVLKTKVNGIRRIRQDSVTYLTQNLSEIQMWIPLVKRFILKTKVAVAFSFPLGESLQNRGNLFQVGGANTLRGYREKEFLTNSYAYSNFELQYLLSTENRALLLLDPGLINRPVGEFYWKRVLGYGAGLDLGAKDWVFAIRYALNPTRSFGNGLIQVKIENRF